MPPHIEVAQAKGFSLYALKALKNGLGSEWVDLAKTNLFTLKLQISQILRLFKKLLERSLSITY